MIYIKSDTQDITPLLNCLLSKPLSKYENHKAALLEVADEKLLPCIDGYPSYFLIYNMRDNSLGGIIEVNAFGDIEDVYSIISAHRFDEEPYNELEQLVVDTSSNGMRDEKSFLAAYHIKHEIEIAHPNDENVRVWVVHDFCKGAENAVMDCYLIDEKEPKGVMEFNTVDDADDYIHEIYPAQYLLAVNELARPKYFIVNK